MADGTPEGGFSGDDAAPRRSTYTPPPVDAEVPATLGESDPTFDTGSAAGSEQPVSPSAPTTPAGVPSTTGWAPPPTPTPAPSIPVAPVAPPSPAVSLPPAPVRRSLSDQEIVARMGGAAGDTSSLIAALQEQMDLRAKEDEEFDSWEALVRQSVDEDTAEREIREGRRAFEKLPPEPRVEPAPPAAFASGTAAPTVSPGVADSPVGGAVPGPEVASREGAPDTVGGVAEPEPVSEPIVLPRWGEQPAAAVTEPPVVPGEATAAFEKILSHDADAPQTDAWPLAEGSIEDSEPTAEALAVVLEEERVLANEDSVVSESMTVAEFVSEKAIPESVFDDVALPPVKRFGFDQIGPEPSPANSRVDRGLQLLWSWWAVGAPLPVVLLGGWLISGGLNFAQAVLASGIGILLAALPVVAGSVVGNRTGLPTLVSSRAAFGLSGNVLPALLMVIVRLLVATAALYAATWTIVGVLVESNYWNSDEVVISLVIGAIVSLLAFGGAIPGRGWVSGTLWVSAGLATLGLIALIVFTVEPITRQATSGAWGSAAELTAGIAVVMSVFLVVWAHFGGDLARFTAPGKAASSSVFATLGAVIPPVVLLAWGALLAASGPEIARGLLDDPFDTILGSAPGWYPLPAIVVFALPLVGIAALALHSSGYALQGLGVRLPRYGAVSIAGGVATVAALLLLALLPGMEADSVAFALVLAVPVAAWVGAYFGDLLTRRVRLDPRVLTGSVGHFPRWRVAPVIGFVASVGIGWGFVSADQVLASWTGYLENLLANLTVVDLSGWQIGPLLALAIALTVSLFAGIRGGVLTGHERNPAP